MVVAVVVIALVVALSGAGGYTVHARFVSASQLVKGNEVKVSGITVGSVQDVALTDDGQADVTLKIAEDGYHPLRRGTRAIIRQASLSGVANRYVDLQLGGADQPDIADGGTLPADAPKPPSTSTRSSTRSTRRPARASRNPKTRAACRSPSSSCATSRPARRRRRTPRCATSTPR